MDRVKSMLKTSVAPAFALLTAIVLLSPVDVAHAQAASPFEGLSGHWSGDGSIVLTSGTTERLRCDATYTVSGGGDNLDQTLRCASDSYTFDLRNSLANKAGVILGSWNEVSKQVEGGISGTASKDLIQITVRGQDFSAAVVVKTHEAEQAVSIRAQSGELSQVAITLHRAH